MTSICFKESSPAAEAGYRNAKFRMAHSSSPGIDNDISAEVPNFGGVNPQTGTSYALVASDQGKLVTLSNAAAVALSLDSTLPAEFVCWVMNFGAGTATLTPSSGTVNGVASIPLATGTGASLFFDGTNWNAVTGGEAGSGTQQLTLTMVVASGATGSSVVPRGVAPRAGSFTKSKVVVDAADATTDLTFSVKNNGTSIFTATVMHGAAVGTLQQSSFAAVTVAENDVFTMDITSGTSSWKFSLELC